MSDSYLAVLAAIVARLKADVTLTALVGSRIYSDVVDNPTFPFVRVEIQSSDYSTKDTPAMQHMITVNGFSRKPSPQEAAQIRAAVYNSLNRAQSSLSGAGISNILQDGAALCFKENDGATWQSVIQFRAVTL